ncbi:Alpha/Beta hydrolase protein [Hygrophoropsis aurantiaca]|uniref:Alpha/Beta hydrolase protein n=1 Tax=Hygrophoropsis aurantiaca TaxID=72124 RepID=A0ACB8ADW7_9AGAM|nr:Alpha/Beta hydrolase protein [Hygrophoropsis aurantiaca]
MYPFIQPYRVGKLEVSTVHSLYYEISGNKNGVPVVFLHGGPGGRVDPEDRQFFDPTRYKIILFDQRGAGKSTPSGCLKENTTWDLVKDMEILRKRIGIEKWHLFGGSWGSTLALAYAQAHPDRVISLVLRGVFTVRKSELRFFYQDGASNLFPEACADKRARIIAAKAWSKWEMSTVRLRTNRAAVEKAVDQGNYASALATIENHYFVNEGFMRDGQLLEKQEIDKIRNIPTIVVQGRYDVVCPPITAYALKKVWPTITLHIVPDAGHSCHEVGIEKLLIEATNQMARLQNK